MSRVVCSVRATTAQEELNSSSPKMEPRPRASGGIRGSAARRTFPLVNTAEHTSGNGSHPCPHHNESIYHLFSTGLGLPSQGLDL